MCVCVSYRHADWYVGRGLPPFRRPSWAAGRSGWDDASGVSPRRWSRPRCRARTAEQLFAVLGDLKGGAMKVGQWMSAMEAALPEQLAGPYGEALTRLQEAAPAMPVSTVHRVLTEDLGRDWRRRFAAFDDEPAAAASIGQVHRAVWVEGTPLAHVARRGDARQRDRAAMLLIRFLLSSPPRAGRLHGDPHPGNFRVLHDDRDHDP